MQNKKQIRQFILQQRNNSDVSPILYQTLLQNAKKYLDTIDNNDYIAGYYPIASELNLLPLFEQFQYIAMPVITPAHDLEFYQWNKNAKMVASLYAPNILEPLQRDKITSPTIVIAPLIACDQLGNRVGSGKGIYDRVISRLRSFNSKLIYLAICYDYQLLDYIPVENHDQKLDVIITETKTLLCKC